MTKTIITFGASSSKNSINKKLANYTANEISNANVKLLDLNDFEMPIFSVDRELESGIPALAYEFKKQVKDVWMNKPMFLLATSPRKHGGESVLNIAVTKFRRMNTNTIVSFSLPSFRNNFSEKEGITNKTLLHTFNKQLALFELTL